jgi:AcrR family transcriptional regulator
MGRWEPGARERLEQAALELFAEQGFAATTVPQITARAGLTTRTFFRHFADKREVLFAGEENLPALVARVMSEAPAAAGPMAVTAYGLETVAAEVFEGRLENLRARRAVVQADEGLRERELRKWSVLSEAVSRGFRDRGADELTAALAAELAVTAFRLALTRWLDQDGERGLAEIVADVLGALRSVARDEPVRPGDAIRAPMLPTWAAPRCCPAWAGDRTRRKRRPG